MQKRQIVYDFVDSARWELTKQKSSGWGNLNLLRSYGSAIKNEANKSMLLNALSEPPPRGMPYAIWPKLPQMKDWHRDFVHTNNCRRRLQAERN